MRQSSIQSQYSADILSSIPTTPKVLTVAIIQAIALQAANAASVEVTSNLDDGTECTLREAVESVNMGSDQGGCTSTGAFGSGDEITFAPSVSGSTITLTGGQLIPTKSVSINPGGSETTISGNNTSRILYSDTNGIEITLDQLYLTDGFSGFELGGAVFITENTLNLLNSTVSGNSTNGNGGGGIYASAYYNNMASLMLTNSTVSDNTTRGAGGGIYGRSVLGGTVSVTLTNSTVSDNSSNFRGGGIAVSGVGYGTVSLTLTNSTVSGNSTYVNGGGIYVLCNQFSGVVCTASATLTNSTVSSNTTDGSGGGVYVESRFSSMTSVTLSDSAVTNNYAGDLGGGIFLSAERSPATATMTLTNSMVSGNSAGRRGGGVAVFSQNTGTASVTLTNSTVSDNSAVANYFGGGGILAAAATDGTTLMMLTNSTVSGNYAYYGGGVQVIADATTSVMLTNSTVSGNYGYHGGGIMAFGRGNTGTASVMLTNSTVSGNSAEFKGGGIYVTNSLGGTTSVTLANSTIADNSVGEDGGGIYVGTSNGMTTVNLYNSIVAKSTGAPDCELLSNATVNADGFNIIEDDVCGTSAMNVDPTLLPLANNGGETETHALMIGSPAIDSGNDAICEATDQRGVARNDGACDIGSYESNPGSPDLTVIAPQVSEMVLTVGDPFTFSATVENQGDADSMASYLRYFLSTDATISTADTQIGGVAIAGLPVNGISNQMVDLNAPTMAGDYWYGACVDVLADESDMANNCSSAVKVQVQVAPDVIPITRKDRKMGSLIANGEQWYSFNSTESQRISMQTNGFIGDTHMEFYQGTDPTHVNPFLAMDDNSGPELFSNLKQNIGSGPHLIRVTGKTNVDPYWLRLISDKDILSFTDTNYFEKEARVMSSAGITLGCGLDIYCPDMPLTRAQMAVFMIRAILGGNYVPPPATGMVFNDVSIESFASNFIEDFLNLGITSGCAPDPMAYFCPDNPVTRAQMAVFLLRAWYGAAYVPPVATAAEINQFSDIASSFAKDWIVQLVKEGWTGGCGGGKFCPTDVVTRGQMAAFIARTFDLDLEL